MPHAKMVLLGVSGSVAAYRACDLARELIRGGFTVRALLTDGAQRFVSTDLFEALTGQPCLIDTFDEPQRGRMAHIDWARQATVLVIAPATANTICKLAAGIGEDMLTTLALAYEGPMLVAPAMNPSMYESAQVQEALRVLSARGADIIEPAEGDVACGESGQGKLASIERIAGEALALAGRARLLAGQSVLITSGPTREPIDMARYVSNRSTGRMGAALARAALLMGAEVHVVSGPSEVSLPRAARVTRVQTAIQMLDAALAGAGDADWIIAAAAVADYRPSEPSAQKLRRGPEDVSLKLTPNPDVIRELAKHTRARCVGFAAEPGACVEAAAAKLEEKGLFAIAANDVSDPGIGFESDENALTLLFRSGEQVRIERASKLVCAMRMLEALALRGGPDAENQ